MGVKKVGGGSVTDSFLVKGVAFKKTFSYAGFEQQPKSFDKPGVLLLNVELELKSEKVRGRSCSVRVKCPWMREEGLGLTGVILPLVLLVGNGIRTFPALCLS